MTPGATGAVVQGQKLIAAATWMQKGIREDTSNVTYPPGHDHGVGRQTAPICCALQDLVPADQDAVVFGQKGAYPPHEPGNRKVRRQSGSCHRCEGDVMHAQTISLSLDLHTTHSAGGCAPGLQLVLVGKALLGNAPLAALAFCPPHLRTLHAMPRDIINSASNRTADLPPQPGVIPCICHRR